MTLTLLVLLMTVGSAEPSCFEEALVVRADSLAAATDAGSVVVFDSSVVRVEENGRSHYDCHVLVKLYDEGAAKAMRVLRLDYDPRANDNQMTSLRIHRADSVVSVQVAQYVDVEAPAHSIYWGGRMRLYLVGDVRVGDMVEYTSYRVGFQIAYLDGPGLGGRFVPPQKGSFYDVVLFGEERPVVRKVYTAYLLRHKPIQFREYNGEIESALRFKGDMLEYIWRMEDIAPVAHEPYSPDDSDFLPKVVLSTLEDWPARARWFNETNEPVFALTEEIREKTSEIIKGLDNDKEKFLALQQWVATHIRYSGLSMGEGEGYTIHPADMIFTERSGVCKDFAGMLIAMLRAAGYEAYPALTMAGARVEDVPADQFNHCVVAVRQDDGSFFTLDPTWCAYSRYPWSRSEGHQHYVIGSPEGGVLMQQPLFVDDNRVQIELKTRLSEDGELSGSFRMEPFGAYETRLRRRLIYRTGPERKALFASYLEGLGSSVVVEKAEYPDPEDMSKRLSLAVTFRVPGYALVSEEKMAFVSPMLSILAHGAQLASIARFGSRAERENPALIWRTRWEECSGEVRLPKSFRFLHADTSVVDIDEGKVLLSARMEARESKLHTQVEARLKDRSLEPEAFKIIHDASTKLEDLAEEVLICQTGRGR